MEPRKMSAVVSALALVRTRENISALAALAATNSKFRALCLPYLFSHVRWPHPGKHDEETGLHFFPESLWPLFKRFDLIWPDDWPDAAPPRWGDRYYVGGDYHPRHTDKLATALPRMPALIAFSICCPFFPPNSLFNALLTCTSVRELRMTDTPLYISMIPKSPPEFVIERLYLIPVAEAPRVGQSPYEARYSSPTLYHSREYRKKYKNDILARYAASAFLFDVGKPTSLTHVQVSGDLCTLDEFAAHDWPRLASLVMTGHPPRQTGTDLVDVISKMPQLKELRLLFAKSVARGDAMFKVLPAAPEYISAKGNRASLLEQISSLAVSDACQLDRVGYFIAGVERLAILAISDIADPTVAFSKRTLQGMLREISAAGTPAPKTIPPKSQSKHHHGKNHQKDDESEQKEKLKNAPPEIVHKNQMLKHLRVMLGEDIEPEFCKFLADRFPKLEVLEVEKCGYHDGRDVPPWGAYVDNLKPIRRTLRSLRLGMQFEAQEDTLHDYITQRSHICGPINDDLLSPPSPSSTTPTPSWRTLRSQCATYFAEHLGQLTRIGFEYRKRPGPHRLDDRWLEWDIERRRFTDEMREEWREGREGRVKKEKEFRRRAREGERLRERAEAERLKKLKEEEDKRREEEMKNNNMTNVGQSARRTCTCPAPTTNTVSNATTPLSYPSSSIPTPTTSATSTTSTSPYYIGHGHGHTHGHTHPYGGGYVMSPPPMIEGGLTTGGHRISSSISGQDYFTNLRTSSTYTPPIPQAQLSQHSSTSLPTDDSQPTDSSFNRSTVTTNSNADPTSTTPSDDNTDIDDNEDDNEDFVTDSDFEDDDDLIETHWDSEDEDPEGILGIYELKPSWYPFPECWKGRTLYEEEEVADAGGVENGAGNGGGGNSSSNGNTGTSVGEGVNGSAA